jgi:hypothetical protein
MKSFVHEKVSTKVVADHDVRMSGYVAQNTGGAGFVAQNSGGIGFNSSMDNAQVQIAQQQAGAAIDQKFSGLIDKLQAVEETLRAKTVDKGKLKSLSDAVFAEKWVPGVITAVLMAILKAVGL